MTESALQTALYNALTGDADVMALASGVYSHFPQADDSADASAFPIVAIGDDAASMWDTKTEFGQNVLCTVNLWSRTESMLEVKRLGGLVRAALHHKPLTISGATHTMTLCERVNYMKEPDGVTQRGVMLVRVYYQENQ